MITQAETVVEAAGYRERVRSFLRALDRKYRPAYKFAAIKEDEFLSRFAAMILLSGAAGAPAIFLSHLQRGFWYEGMLLAGALSLAAQRPKNIFGFSLGVISGIFFGVILQLFTYEGLRLFGIAALGAGIGARMGESSGSVKIKLDTVLLTALTAALGGAALYKLGPIIEYAFGARGALPIEWAILGLFISIGALPLHLVIAKDKIIILTRRAKARLETKYHELIDRLLDKYFELSAVALKRDGAEAEAALRRRDRIADSIIDAADYSIGIQEVEKSLAASSEEALTARLDELLEKLSSVGDAGVKSEIEKLIKGINESLSHREKIKLEGERLKLQLLRAEMEATACCR